MLISFLPERAGILVLGIVSAGASQLPYVLNKGLYECPVICWYADLNVSLGAYVVEVDIMLFKKTLPLTNIF